LGAKPFKRLLKNMLPSRKIDEVYGFVLQT
jgi:hypothetical protein